MWWLSGSSPPRCVNLVGSDHHLGAATLIILQLPLSRGEKDIDKSGESRISTATCRGRPYQTLEHRRRNYRVEKLGRSVPAAYANSGAKRSGKVGAVQSHVHRSK